MLFFYFSAHCWMSNWSLKSLHCSFSSGWFSFSVTSLSVSSPVGKRSSDRQSIFPSSTGTALGTGSGTSYTVRQVVRAVTAGAEGHGQAAAHTAWIKAQKTRFKPGSVKSHKHQLPPWLLALLLASSHPTSMGGRVPNGAWCCQHQVSAMLRGYPSPRLPSL